MQERAILVARNDDVDKINNKIIDSFQGNLKVYNSIDTPLGDDAVNYPAEFLNKLHPSGVPPHRLALKKGIPVMLMRNIDPQGGLCNGTRLIIKDMLRNVIVADIITGEFSGKTVFIPR